jgi:transmembrane sensor
MTLQHPLPETEPSAAVIAEAAAWLAILHGPNRTRAAEEGCSAWLKTNSLHSRAFEQATEIWEVSRNLPRPARIIRTKDARALLRAATVFAAAIVAVTIGFKLYSHYAGVTTDIGEERLLTLEDGTRIVLNTTTRIVLSYNRQSRHVELKTGEALFDVAKRPNWPFVVTVGDRQIRALGTEFVVRRDPHRLAVTLVEGKVTVLPAGDSSAASGSAADLSTGIVPANTKTIALAPGQRLTFDDNRPTRLDKPALDQVLGWQRREITLDDAPLPDAVAEMNRYSTIALVIEEPGARTIHVTGLFRAGDSLSFARAVAATYGLEIVEEPHRLVLAGLPHSAPPGSPSQ